MEPTARAPGALEQNDPVAGALAELEGVDAGAAWELVELWWVDEHQAEQHVELWPVLR